MAELVGEKQPWFPGHVCQGHLREELLSVYVRRQEQGCPQASPRSWAGPCRMGEPLCSSSLHHHPCPPSHSGVLWRMAPGAGEGADEQGRVPPGGEAEDEGRLDGDVRDGTWKQGSRTPLSRPFPLECWCPVCFALEVFPGAILSPGYRPFPFSGPPYTCQAETSGDRLDGGGLFT